MPVENNGNWDCDARKVFGKCLRGLTGFGQTKGVKGFSCRPCNFDVCDKCMQAVMLIDRILERED